MYIETGIWTNSFSTGKTYCLQFPGQLCPWKRTACRALCLCNFRGAICTKLCVSLWTPLLLGCAICSLASGMCSSLDGEVGSDSQVSRNVACSEGILHNGERKDLLNKWLTFYRKVKSLCPNQIFFFFKNFLGKNFLAIFAHFSPSATILPLIRSED